MPTFYNKPFCLLILSYDLEMTRARQTEAQFNIFPRNIPIAVERSRHIYNFRRRGFRFEPDACVSTLSPPFWGDCTGTRCRVQTVVAPTVATTSCSLQEAQEIEPWLVFKRLLHFMLAKALCGLQVCRRPLVGPEVRCVCVTAFNPLVFGVDFTPDKSNGN